MESFELLSGEELKLRGNEEFAQNRFNEAEKYYRQSLLKDNKSHSVYTNLAAALIRQQKYDEAIEAADISISLDPTWVKAYFRKYTALEELSRHREAFEVWTHALKNTTKNKVTEKYYEDAKAKWIKLIRSTPIFSSEDFLARYKLLKSPREKLSTLAHFWNCSSQVERYAHFCCFLDTIGGEGELSEESKSIEGAMMLPMPMQNYEDLTMDKIANWCSFFNSLASTEKTALLKYMWECLTSAEQTAVIMDLRQFMAKADFCPPEYINEEEKDIENDK
jgi:hypothetical protein